MLCRFNGSVGVAWPVRWRNAHWRRLLYRRHGCADPYEGKIMSDKTVAELMALALGQFADAARVFSADALPKTKQARVLEQAIRRAIVRAAAAIGASNT